ncbi:RagB/SusD family nutrient uptake outer membrane protein [Arenibacter sp. ARW7G5Y1]|uniref:RagB/SusD family nutrient uptake outer membrane protein n=1 Tax=Arenibacter sp. ARW7G5Y1 TaxID=2135619 RepID=UPI000D7562CB|nr:RagB/SusD family nutrient uptake outer membrane protein [Arenibacter sp. ARW7G5Y1]PXX21714.1 putative outer membrane starch-binding protein [Arenibacter sp. ARW7G5Y1]
MKKYIYIILVFISLIVVGCNDDFLEKYPDDAITDQVYWKTPNDLKVFANQFYGSLDGPANIVGPDDTSDNQVPTNLDAYTNGLTVVPASASDAGWTWDNIRNVNYFLSRYQTVEGNPEEINKYVAEVRFFRAKFYFDKVVRFGDVPWYETDLNTASTEELYKPRDSRELVMAKVMEDLDYAIENLPETPETGRLSTYAAAALKSRAALFEGTFRKYHNGTTTYPGSDDGSQMLTESIEASEYIMNSDKFRIVKLADEPSMDYQNLFLQEELNGDKEGILVRRYLADVLTQNLTRQVQESRTGFSKEFVKSYLVNNGLPISYNGAPNPAYYGDNLLADETSDRDPRLKQTIWYPGRVWQISPTGEETFLPNFPDFNRQSTGYYNLKYASPSILQWNYNLSTLDVYVFRYAEVLLNYAEAKAEMGNATQAVLDASLNLIRDRISLPHMTTNGTNVGSAAVPGVSITSSTTWPDYGYSLTPLLQEIRRERRVELAGEGFRFNDLIRWRAGNLLNNPETIVGVRITDDMEAKWPVLVPFERNANDQLVVYPGKPNRVWNDKLYLHPLPSNELILNPDLGGQNPGW